MPHSVIAMFLHLIPAFIAISIFFIIFDVKFKSHNKSDEPLPPSEPDINELEQKLQKLIEANNLENKTYDLQQELKQTPTHIISAYIRIDKNHLKGFHFFQLIFSLIKNGAEDNKIIKIMHHHLPSCPTSHLYAMLKSFKEFLSITDQDKKEKILLKDLNQNYLKSTLLYLQDKLNQTLNKVPSMPPALQQPLIDEAVIYGLVFAAFAQFYQPTATEKILRLVNQLAPNIFHYWHTPPKPDNTSNKKYFRPNKTR